MNDVTFSIHLYGEKLGININISQKPYSETFHKVIAHDSQRSRSF
uniref:Uncharacterized protein n=1 Tax=Anguilla anguilla TaxID=7936 RepID=A0A0E9WJS9_ANGAN